MKKTIAIALSIISFTAHSAVIEISDEGKNQQSINYYCAVSDRFVTLSANAAMSGGDLPERVAVDAGKPLMLTQKEIKDYINYMKSNLDIAQQVSRGFNSGQSCYLAPQNWIVGYQRLVEEGKLK